MARRKSSGPSRLAESTHECCRKGFVKIREIRAALQVNAFPDAVSDR
jgi:hypothetical protein